MDESEHNETEEESQHETEKQSEQELEESKQSRTEHNNQDKDDLFNDEDIQNLKDIFDLFDKDQSGKIESADLENIITSLKRDPEEAKQMLDEIDPNHDGQITFQEFIQLMSRIENKLDKKDDIGEQESEKQEGVPQEPKDIGKRTTIQTDSRVLDFLILLEDHRCK